MLDEGGVFDHTTKGFITGPLATLDQTATYRGRFVRFQTIALRDGSSGSAISAPGVEAFGILRDGCLSFEYSSGYLSEIQQGGNTAERGGLGHTVNVTRDSITLDFLQVLDFNGWFLGLLSLCFVCVSLSFSLSPKIYNIQYMICILI
jgi:hypothetical protein